MIAGAADQRGSSQRPPSHKLHSSGPWAPWAPPRPWRYRDHLLTTVGAGATGAPRGSAEQVGWVGLGRCTRLRVSRGAGGKA